MKKILVVLGVALLLLIILFEIHIDFQFSMPHEIEVADPEQETQYQACVDERDAEIHKVAFGTIDNPDVQREYLSTHKDIAKAECRLAYPERKITEQQPFRLKVVELEFRFSD